MTKPQKGTRAGQVPATDADNEQHGGELPQESISNATDTPQPDAEASAGPTDGTGTGEGTDSDPDHLAAAKTPGDATGDAAGDVSAPLTGEQEAGATGSDNEQQGGGEPEPVTDDRSLVRFTGPWKNYSRGDITRLPKAEAELVINKALAEAEAEPDRE